MSSISNVKNPFSITTSGMKKPTTSSYVPFNSANKSVAGAVKLPTTTSNPSNSAVAGLMTSSITPKNTSTNQITATPTTTTIASQPPVNYGASSASQTPQNNSTVPKNGVISFPGIAGDIINTSKPNTTQTGLLGNLSETASGNAAIGKDARAIAERYGAEIANVGKLGAGAVAGNLSTGTNVVGSGNAAIASQSASQRMSALAQAGDMALQGTGQQLTGQQQMANAYGQALGGANTQQSMSLSGLGSAAGLVPEALRYGAFDGGGNGSLSPQSRAQELAQQVRSGQLSPQMAEQQMSSLYGGAGATFLNQALQGGGGYNYNQGAAQSAAMQSNIQQAGTAQTDIARQGLTDATQMYNTGNTMFKTTALQGENLRSAMQGVNALDARFANTQLNKLKNQFGDAQYSAFITALNETKQAYTNLLSSLGAATPTVNGQQADQILGESATPGQINAAIAELDKAAYAKLLPMYELMQTYQSNLGGGGSSGGNYGGSGGSIYSF